MNFYLNGALLPEIRELKPARPLPDQETHSRLNDVKRDTKVEFTLKSPWIFEFIDLKIRQAKWRAHRIQQAPVWNRSLLELQKGMQA